MMKPVGDILAEGKGNLVSLVLFVVMALLFVVAKLAERFINKASERAEQRRQAAGQEPRPGIGPQRGAEDAPAQLPYPPMPTVRSVRNGQIRRQTAQPQSLRPRPAVRQPAQQHRPAAIPRPVAIEPINLEPVQVAPHPVQAAPRPQPVPVPPSQVRTSVADSEALQTQTRRRRMDQQVRRKMAPRRPARPEDQPTENWLSAIGGSLHGQAGARVAIVLHEIFSPPKALRQGGEMWDV